MPFGRKCHHAATTGFRVKRGYYVRLRMTYFTYLTYLRTHLLLAGNDTVPIATWHGQFTVTVFDLVDVR